jgi:acetyl esterase/lipase
MKITKILALAIATSISIIGCKKDEAVVITPTDATLALTDINVSYGTDPSYQKFDIYLPANRTDTGTKVIVFVHGGSWIAGDKSDFNQTIASLKMAMPNYAFVNINYRLAQLPSTNIWPVQLDDVKSCFNYLDSKASYYHINTNKIAVFGASAGAHLAMLKAYQDNANKKIKAVVNLFGPTEMKDLYNFQSASNQQLIAVFLNGTPSSAAAAYNSASPLYAVTSAAPPTITFHGTADLTVPLSNSTKLDSALVANNVISNFNKYAGEGHGFSDSTNAKVFAKSIAFINTYLK